MAPKHHDSVFTYKKIEAELNKRIHAHTNSRAFTIAFGRAMEAHLKRVRIHKRLTTKWLKLLEIANKDEIAALSIRLVDCEEKIDFLDDTVYLINKMMKGNQYQLKIIRESWEEWSAFLKSEVREIRDHKINSLENELLELRALFNREIDIEDIDNDCEKRKKTRKSRI